MGEVVLVRYGEIGLKGRNRPAFENRLVENVRRALGSDVQATVRKEYGRIVVDFGEEEAPQGAIDRIRSVFGVVSSQPGKGCRTLDRSRSPRRACPGSRGNRTQGGPRPLQGGDQEVK